MPVIVVFRMDLDSFLKCYRARIKVFIHIVDGYRSLWLLVANLPEDRVGPAILRKQTGMEVEKSMRGHMQAAFRNSVRESHDKDGIRTDLLDPWVNVLAVRHQEGKLPAFRREREVIRDVSENKGSHETRNGALFKQPIDRGKGYKAVAEDDNSQRRSSFAAAIEIAAPDFSNMLACCGSGTAAS